VTKYIETNLVTSSLRN